jgi:PDZ domain-containing protein
VGLGLAGYEVEVEGQGARVVSVLPESLAIDTLQPGDVIVRLNTDPIRGTAELISRLSLEEPGGRVRLEIERNGRSQPAAVTLMPPVEADGPPRLGITVESAGFDINLPFPVEIVPQKISGGPSAGLMFALTVYNMVTPEDLTGGRKIAGTGTIDLEGRVGIIGGVEQKVVAAERAGAEIFLAPPENYEDAHAVARRIRVVEVATAQEAIRFLAGLPPLQGEQ